MIQREPKKIEWQGRVVSVQPRTTVWRYRLDNRTHYLNGYNIFIGGEADGEKASVFNVLLPQCRLLKLNITGV